MVLFSFGLQRGRRKGKKQVCVLKWQISRYDGVANSGEGWRVNRFMYDKN